VVSVLEGREAFPCYRAKICEFEEKRKFFLESLEEGSHVWFSRLEEAVLEGIFEERLSRSFLKWFEFSCEMDFGTVKCRVIFSFCFRVCE